MEQSEAALQPVGASRNWDEDADPNEEGFLPPLPIEPPRVFWMESGTMHGADTLVVGLAGAGELFVRHCLCGSLDAKRIGVLLLPQAGDINRLPASAEEAAEEPGAAIISRAANALFVSAPVCVPVQPCARNGSRQLLNCSSIAPPRCLCASHLSDKVGGIRVARDSC